MPNLSHEDAIFQYWEEVKEKYPDLSFIKFKAICKFPFDFIKRCMRDDALPVILIKFLGKIKPGVNVVRNMAKVYEKKNTDGTYTEKVEFLKKFGDELERYEDNEKNKPYSDREIILEE